VHYDTGTGTQKFSTSVYYSLLSAHRNVLSDGAPQERKVLAYTTVSA